VIVNNVYISIELEITYPLYTISSRSTHYTQFSLSIPIEGVGIVLVVLITSIVAESTGGNIMIG
jgi:hypothetical protein